MKYFYTIKLFHLVSRKDTRGSQRSPEQTSKPILTVADVHCYFKAETHV